MKANNTELEQLLMEAIADGIGRSSLLASSLAAKLSYDREFIALILSKIDKEKLAIAIASEVVRKGKLGNSGQARDEWTGLMREVRDRAADMLATKMEKELENV